MASAVKLPSGKYCCKVWDKYQKKQVYFTCETKKEAERQASLYKLTLQPRVATMTFEEAAEAYLANKKNILSPNTIRDYSTSLKHHVEQIKARKIDTITDSVLQKMINDISLSLSPKSVKNVYGFVTAVIRSVDPHKTFSVTLPRKIKQEIKMPSEDDIRIILDRVKGTSLDVYVRLALCCCLRRGEIAALMNHPECIGKDCVTIKYNMIKSGNEWIEKSPKTYTSYRTVPCPQDLIKDIKKAPRLNPGEITDKWIKLKTGYRFHDIRHASASLMLSANIPTIDVEKFGGWRHGSSVLQDIYAYNVDESLKKSADIWQGKLEKLVMN